MMTMDRNEIADIIVRLRADGKALEGDGFGHVGHLKGAYKKVVRHLEEFLEILDSKPLPEVKIEVRQDQPSPDCFGENEHNVPGCECRRIFEQVLAGSSAR